MRWDRGQRAALRPDRAGDDADLERDDEDDVDAVPKSVVIDPRFDWEGDRRPNTPLHETVIYETHVQAASRSCTPRCARTCAAPTPGSPPSRRSTTCATSASPRSSCCRSTTSPTSRSCPSAACRTTGATRRSASSPRTPATPPPAQRGQEVREFKGMVKALHRAGIEVILDVVYNHTAEGNHLGPMLSFKGVDNKSLLPARARRPAPLHGLHGHRATRSTPQHPSVLRLIMDSLRYWVDRVPRRRLPLRPRERAGPRALRRRPAVARSSTSSTRTRCSPRSS